jgi:hypothetical protein
MSTRQRVDINDGDVTMVHLITLTNTWDNCGLGGVPGPVTVAGAPCTSLFRSGARRVRPPATSARSFKLPVQSQSHGPR